MDAYGADWDCPRCGRHNAGREFCAGCRMQRPSAPPPAVVPVAKRRPKRPKGQRRAAVLGVAAGVLVGLALFGGLLTRQSPGEALDRYVEGKGGVVVHSDEDHFTATFPKKPDRRAGAFGPWPSGRSIPMTTFTFEHEGSTIGVAVSRLTPGRQFDIGPAPDVVAAAAKGLVVASERVTAEDLPAIEFRIDVPAERVHRHELVILGPRRLYRLLAIDRGRQDPRAFARLVSSFEVT